MGLFLCRTLYSHFLCNKHLRWLNHTVHIGKHNLEQFLFELEAAGLN